MTDRTSPQDLQLTSARHGNVRRQIHDVQFTHVNQRLQET